MQADDDSNQEISPRGEIDFKSDFVAFLYSSHGELADSYIKKAEEYTGQSRENLAYIACGLNAVYLILGNGAALLCNLIGFAYPAYQSVIAIRTTETADDTAWLIYWTVFATFSLIDFFAQAIMSVFPLYWLVKCIFLMYLYLPQTKGSKVVYYKVVDPLFNQINALLGITQKTE